MAVIQCAVSERGERCPYEAVMELHMPRDKRQQFPLCHEHVEFIRNRWGMGPHIHALSSKRKRK